MTESVATVATLAAAAGNPLADERLAELAPLYEALRTSAEGLRTVDLGGYEPLGPGAPGRE